MSGPERNFTLGVNKHLDPPSLHHEGMANPYRGGTADHWYSGGLDLWVEYKWVDLPTRPDTIISIVKSTPKTKPSLSVLQQHWLRDRVAEGRSCWVVIGCKLGGLVLMGGGWDVDWTRAEFVAGLRSKKEIGALISNFCRE